MRTVLCDRLAGTILPPGVVSHCVESNALKKLESWFERFSRVWVPPNPLRSARSSRSVRMPKTKHEQYPRPLVPVRSHLRRRPPRFLRKNRREGLWSSCTQHQRVPPAPHLTFECLLPGQLCGSRLTAQLQGQQREECLLHGAQRYAGLGYHRLSTIPLSS